jgi:pyruvate dehydrogenase E1 component alpha subunit
MLACGMDPKGVMAELTGRATGYSRGKGGSMHMFSREKNFFGGHGIVAAQVPIGTGLAFAQKYRGDGGITFCYLGDGAVNQGQVYEASTWRRCGSCVVYVIENNKYGMGTSGSALLERRAVPARPGLWHSRFPDRRHGRDPRSPAGRAAGRRGARRQRTCVLELQTYRYRGHSMSDPAKYRSKEEVSRMRQEHDRSTTPRRSCWLRRRRRGGAEGNRPRDQGDRRLAADFAQASAEPDAAELYTDVLLEA